MSGPKNFRALALLVFLLEIKGPTSLQQFPRHFHKLYVESHYLRSEERGP
jgi:hypothetical protein